MDQQDYIQQALDTAYPAFNQAGTPYYLPTLLQDSKYDPYGPFEFDIAQLTDQNLLNAAAGICPDISIQSSPCADPFYVSAPAPPNYPSLSLQNCSINGMSNCAAERPIAGGGDGRLITMQIDLSPPALPTPVTLTGAFIFTQYCCCSKDGTTPEPPPQPEVGKGTFTTTIPSSNMVLTISITNIQPGVLDLVVSSVAFNVPNGSDGGPNMTVQLDITSIPQGANRDSYNNVAMEAVGGVPSRISILGQIQAAMNQSDALSKVGNMISQNIHQYLSNYHLYPFNGASAAIV